MSNIEKVINELNELNGNKVDVFGRKVVVNNSVEWRDLTIDTRDVLNHLKEFEVTEYCIEEYDDAGYIENETIYNITNDEDISKYIDYLEGEYGLEYRDGDNTYNWSSPIMNNLHWEHYYSETLDKHYYVCNVHLYGDVRGNYSDSFILETYNDYVFLETLSESDEFYTLEDKEGNEIYFQLSIFNEGLTNECGEYEYNVLYLLDYENIDDLQKDILK